MWKQLCLLPQNHAMKVNIFMGEKSICYSYSKIWRGRIKVSTKNISSLSELV